MQTFLPYPDFGESALALDQKRLGKQRVEVIQVLRGLTVPGYGWRHHPAVKMWAGYEEALVRYGLEVCRVWSGRGHKDTCSTTLVVDLEARCGVSAIRSQIELTAAGDVPPWLGDPALHLSHQAALVRKDPEYYGPRFGAVTPDLPYLWPSSDRERSCQGEPPPGDGQPPPGDDAPPSGDGAPSSGDDMSVP